MKEADVVRCKAVSCEQELNDALRLTAAAFKEEVSGSGMTAAQWVHFERRHLLRHTRPWDFPDIGVAKRGSTVVGAIMLRTPSSTYPRQYCEVWRQLGLVKTFWTYFYDQLVIEHFKAGECLIDFIAVSPEACGRGIGKQLMEWAESAALPLLRKHHPSLQCCKLCLWVGVDNTAARALYRSCGYQLVKDSRRDWFWFMWARIHKSFLGYPYWLRLQKSLLENEQDHTRAPCTDAPIRKPLLPIVSTTSRSQSGVDESCPLTIRKAAAVEVCTSSADSIRAHRQGYAA